MPTARRRLDQVLVERKLVPTRSKAGAVIMAGLVKVDGQRVDKAGYFVKSDAKIEIKELPKYVSRGGDKLASVADKLKLNFSGAVVMDVGSSTGGFTDFALQHGAKKVYAVDVGTGQLAWKLRQDPKVVVMERTDIRNVRLERTAASSKQQVARENTANETGHTPHPTFLVVVPDVIVIDVSFISLKLIMPAVVRLCGQDTVIIAMAKPHFEADYLTASKHKGVIKNDKIRREILKNVETFLRGWFVILDKADSKVLGRKGNRERFYLLRKLPA